MFQRSPEEWSDLCAEHVRGMPTFSAGPAHLYEGGVKGVKQLTDELGAGFFASMDVVEIGSGWGRLAMGFLGENLHSYHGEEIIWRCVQFCNMAFEPWPHFKFSHADVHNEWYNATGTMPPNKVRYYSGTASADLVLLSSVFTHIPQHDATLRVLAEAHRILRPGGLMLCTWIKQEMYPEGRGAAMVVRPEQEIRDFLHAWTWVHDWVQGYGQRKRQWKILVRKL